MRLMFCSILKPAPYDLEIQVGENDGLMIAVPIARDRFGTRIVSVVSELAEAEIDGTAHWEFSFSIDVYSMDDSFEPFRTQDRQIAATFVPNSIRSEVVDVVCQSLKLLTSHIKPALIYWVTKDRDPPEKALKKYHMLR